jgi:hypothetical protein
MKLNVEITGDLRVVLSEEIADAKLAVSTGVRKTGETLKKAWRGQVAGALGRRLGNAVRSEDYPNHPSLRAASFVYAQSAKKRNSRGADQIIAGFDQGAVITARDGLWLAIPLPGAGRGRNGRRNITPLEWEQKTGRGLRFVYRRGKTALLVDDGTVTRDRILNKRGEHVRARGFKNKTVPIFALVPQVKLPKRLNLDSAVTAAQAQLAGNILAAWPRAT